MCCRARRNIGDQQGEACRARKKRDQRGSESTHCRFGTERKTWAIRRTSRVSGPITCLPSTRLPRLGPSEPGKSRRIRRVPEAALTKFKTECAPVRHQRSACCNAGTLSCQPAQSCGAETLAGATGGPVAGMPRWPRVCSMTFFSVMKAVTTRRPPHGAGEHIFAKDSQEQFAPSEIDTAGPLTRPDPRVLAQAVRCIGQSLG